MRTFAAFSGSRDNNFNLLRFIAAFMVIVSHSFLLSIGTSAVKPFGQSFSIGLGTVGVFIFFTTSGYLIAMSYCNRHDLAAFLIARGLRIFPAICVCSLLSAFILGPWMSSLGIVDYFKDLSVYKYAINNSWLFHRRETLPGVFVSNPYPREFNGSLWTLPIELRCYMLVAAIGVVGLFRRRRIVSILLLASLIMIVIACRWGGFTTPVWILPAFFLSGVLFYINRDLVPTNGLIGLGLGMGAALAYRTMLLPILAGSFLVYAVFWFAYVPDGWIRKYNDLGDYSYGLYIYAFPVQQTLAALRPGIAPLPMFLAAFPLVAGLAVVSWHVVEKPSLALKERIGTFSLFNWRWKAANAATSEQSIAGKALNNRIIDNPASLAELPPQ